MNDKPVDQDTFRTLQLMTELEPGEQLSQRELANRLGMAVGLVNSYLKNFVAKGWVRVKSYPRNRYAYLLTPKGFSEKRRLVYQHVSYFTGLYTSTRQGYLELFGKLQKSGINELVFAGVDEVAEIAFLSLSESSLSLLGVFDQQRIGENFLGYTIQPLETIDGQIVVSSMKRKVELLLELEKIGIQPHVIHLPSLGAL